MRFIRVVFHSDKETSLIGAFKRKEPVDWATNIIEGQFCLAFQRLRICSEILSPTQRKTIWPPP